MFFTVLATAGLVVGIGAAVKAVKDEAAFLRVRRRGVEIQADVVDNDASPVGNRNTYFLTPVVRYRLNGRSYTAALCNPNGTPGGVGAGMTILVHPDHPYAPYDRYGGMGTQSRNLLLLFALTVADFAMMLALR
ncbi:hypothetical protein OG896_01065 [Streptomyces sp. NBC_00669]|uniref:DUF3592 domain-containing protein n=1 Tax=unclassified Streptomyces TaxID=2593676 RepID=UPI002E30D4CC|nr:DUF3592 domain-containing protein [Streptomyces sp. NBC_00669]